MGEMPYNASFPCGVKFINHEGSAKMVYKKTIIRSTVMVLLVTVLVSVIPLVSTGKASAKTAYPIVKKDGLSAQLSKTYTFKSPNYNYNYTGKSTRYAYIYKKGKKIAKLKLTNYKEMYCIGKYKGRYYFNVRVVPDATAVYSYKLGDTKFKRVCKGLNFGAFRKTYVKYQKNYSGIMGGRYIIARDDYPTDAYGGFGNAYVYDLKKNKKILLGNARDVIWINDKIYWTTTVPFDWAHADDPVIVVNEATISGKEIRTIKTIPIKDLGSRYGSGTIDKNYIVWKFMTNDGNVTIKEKYR
jgi:hypothetical protein